MSSAVVPTRVEGDAQSYENEHVHAVYEQIASHFSSTRYKPWPIISNFLDSLPTGWIGLDAGCGNGKYLPLPLNRPSGSVWTIGLDKSLGLLQFARTAGEGRVLHEVLEGDVLQNLWRNGVFDYAISIATVHHLATHERRRKAVQRLIEAVSSTHGRGLIYTWAKDNHDTLSKRVIPDTDEGDVFVPWKKQTPQDSQPQVFKRYYHMFAQGELLQLVMEAAERMSLAVGEPTKDGESERRMGIQIMQDGWERSNYYVEFQRWTS